MRAAFVEGFINGFGNIFLMVVVKHSIIDNLTTHTLEDRVKHWKSEQLDYYNGSPSKNLKSRIKVAEEWIAFPWVDKLMRVPPVGLCLKN